MPYTFVPVSLVSHVPIHFFFFCFVKTTTRKRYSSVRILECLLWYKCWVGALFSFGALPCWCHLKVAACHNYAFIVPSCKWFISLSVQQSVCLFVCQSVHESFHPSLFLPADVISCLRSTRYCCRSTAYCFFSQGFFYSLTAYRFYRTRYAAPEKPLTSKSRNLWLGGVCIALFCCSTRHHHP